MWFFSELWLLMKVWFVCIVLIAALKQLVDSAPCNRK